MRDSATAKAEGTEFFRAKQWDEALVSYRAALTILPARMEPKSTPMSKGKERIVPDLEDNLDIGPSLDASESKPDTSAELIPEIQDIPLTGPEAECAKARAILNGNIGACYVKLVRLDQLCSPGLLLKLFEFRTSIRKP